jgi:Putative metallopeptidase
MAWTLLRVLLCALAGVLVLSAATAADAKPAKRAKTDRIDIAYVAPKSPEHQPVLELVKEHRTLEKIKQLLSPLRLPRRLLIKTEGCDGTSNAWYDGKAVIVCYEYLDEVWKNVPEEATPAGVTPIDALVGPVMDVFLHEAGHAVFDILQVPLFGREEDAADQFSVYIMLKMQKDEARRLILGNAYQYKGDLESPTVSIPLKKFADEHGTPSQRYFNVLCLAYGADKELFADFVSNGLLPKERATGCEDEYAQVKFAFDRLITPSMDKKIAGRLQRRWLLPADTRPKKRLGGNFGWSSRAPRLGTQGLSEMAGTSGSEAAASFGRP